MGYEISPTWFHFTKRSLIQKSELTSELKSMITKNILTYLPPTNHYRNVIFWNAHIRRGWGWNFLLCKPRNQLKSEIMEVLLLHLLTQIYLYPHCTISANWSTLTWKSYGLFQVEELQNILPHSWSRQWFSFRISWSSTSNPWPQWMWYSQQSWYRKQSC